MRKITREQSSEGHPVFWEQSRAGGASHSPISRRMSWMQCLGHSSILPWCAWVICPCGPPSSAVSLAQSLGPRDSVNHRPGSPYSGLCRTLGCTLSKEDAIAVSPPPTAPAHCFLLQLPVSLPTGDYFYQPTPACPPWTCCLYARRTCTLLHSGSQDCRPALKELQDGANIPGNKEVSHIPPCLIPSHFQGIISRETEAQRAWWLHVA